VQENPKKITPQKKDYILSPKLNEKKARKLTVLTNKIPAAG
jgi:hypothetical protein